MRKFLPIKGPGGRALTPNEKVALLILGITLVLCVLTLLAGEGAYGSSEPQNPIFGFVALLGGLLGAGILAFYGIVMLWSGLIYFRGERIAKVAPLAGRLIAALAVAIGVSGALGIARLGTAGDMGLLLGRALHNTFGAGVGFPVLLLMMMLGFHLASQGVWTALRDTATAAPALGGAGGASGFGTTYAEPPRHRVGAPASLPDDGDPSADERSLAVTQAMEEIERSKGVTIVRAEQEDDQDRREHEENEGNEHGEESDEGAVNDQENQERASIGEEVEQAPPPPEETEEAEILRRLRNVTAAMDVPRERQREIPEEYADLEVRDLAEVEAEPARPTPAAFRNGEGDDEGSDGTDREVYEVADHGGVPVPPEALERLEEREEVAEQAPMPQTHFRWDQPAAAAGQEMELQEIVPAPEESEQERPSEPEPQAESDPYALGGLLKRIPKHAEDPPPDIERSHTSFDWRGRPLE